MRIKQLPKKPLEKLETIFEMEYRLKQEAKAISNTFVHIKEPKYLLKR